MGLYHECRPESFDQVVGQKETVKILKRMVRDENVPHAIMFVGFTGTGKTSCARILKEKLECSDVDFAEMNCSEVRGIDTIRDIQREMRYAPIGGDKRIYLIDEAQGLTPDAQGALLKIMEDTPDHVYFFLCTTNPTKLISTLRNRCTELKFSPLNDAELSQVITYALSCKKKKLSDEVMESLIRSANGSARAALVTLEKVITLDDEEERLNCIVAADGSTASVEICRRLNVAKPDWKSMAKLLQKIDADPEGIRNLVLAYFTKVMLDSKDPARIAKILTCFEDNYYSSGKAGLVLSCWNSCRV